MRYRSFGLLFQILFLICLAFMITSLQGCSKKQEHKWMFYDLDGAVRDGGKGVVYRGYKTTESGNQVNDPLKADLVAKLDDKNVIELTKLDKPTIDEDDQVHFVVFGSIPIEASCQFTETPYTQPHDSKLVPQHKTLADKAPKFDEDKISKRIVCDLDAREKGSTKIDYTLLESKKVKPEVITGGDILLKDSVLVHELYRYRILAGPVFSTLQKRNKNYQLSPNGAGQTVITATAAQDSPANFALLLKVYHTKRDVLDPPSLFSKRWHETFNPIIGINLLDKPLQNFYAGISFEPWGGFDIVGGVHWGKTKQLVDGFSQGQEVTQTDGLTKERFNNGWFIGVAADVGVIGTWLQKAGSGILGAFKTQP